MRIPILVLVAAGVALSAPAAAESMSIRYNDLKLATPQGQKELARRIDQAARDVCGMDAQRTGTRLPGLAARKCYADAKAAATEHFASIVADSQLGG